MICSLKLQDLHRFYLTKLGLRWNRSTVAGCVGLTGSRGHKLGCPFSASQCLIFCECTLAGNHQGSSGIVRGT